MIHTNQPDMDADPAKKPGAILDARDENRRLHDVMERVRIEAVATYGARTTADQIERIFIRTLFERSLGA